MREKKRKGECKKKKIKGSILLKRGAG